MRKESLIKKEIIKKASKNPELFYPIKALEKFGLKRYECQICKTKFWAKNPSKICGETEHLGGYTFIENSPVKNKFEFIDIYRSFSNFMKKRGYTPIKRFPVLARHRDDLDFTIASIVGFQPYVVSGQVEPVANPLTIPQICLRFSDIDNVGYSGRHHTGFTMIGQHAFMKNEEFNKEKYFVDWFEWHIKEYGLDINELKIHEDAWAGGGNCGASLEIFSRGLEISNQVYMSYEIGKAEKFDDLVELDIKVLDMGMGQERLCWLSKGSKNSYEANMPKVCGELFKLANIKIDMNLYEKFLPYSGNLNLDEVKNIEKVWEGIAKKIDVSVEKLKKNIDVIAGIYSIADHSRTLLYALSDGALPSNVKGGYNLRLILRRALDFISKYNWKINLFEIMKLHSEELYLQYPELKDNLEDIRKIIDVEIKKYYVHKQKVKNKINNIIKKNQKLSQDDYIKLYISDGITPQEISECYKKVKKEEINIPENFYLLVYEYFERQKENNRKKENEELKKIIKDLPKTQLIFYKDSNLLEFDANIIKEINVKNKKYLILDKTIFYPTGGGQIHDVGFIGDKKVIDVIKIDNVVLHQIE